jgi:hypothetical protein
MYTSFHFDLTYMLLIVQAYLDSSRELFSMAGAFILYLQASNSYSISTTAGGPFPLEKKIV